MATSSQQPWSTNPYAPDIPHLQYLAEKEAFIGDISGSIFYGTRIYLCLCPPVLILFFFSVHRTRVCDRPVLPMYGRVARSHRTCKGHQVGTRGPHYAHVLV